MNKDNLLTIPALLLSLVAAHGQPPQFTISTVAGNGTAGFSGDGGLATTAEINTPYMVAVAPDGSLYIADLSNNRIRKVTSAGLITTVAGTGAAGFSGDNGSATAAQLNMPSSVFLDNAGNLFIADQFNNRVRKITTNGVITTVAGPGPFQGYCGDGGLATNACLNGPIDAVTDANGTLFIAEFGSNAIRKVSASGIITTVAGGNATGGSRDGGPATAAALSGPIGVAATSTGDIIIADAGNNRIRKVSNGIITTIAGNPRRSREMIHFCSFRLTHTKNRFATRQKNPRAISSTPQACGVL